MSSPSYRTYFLADWWSNPTDQRITMEAFPDYDPQAHHIDLPSGVGAIERVSQLKYEYWAKTGTAPTKLITWPKFYEQLMGAMMMFQGASGFPNIIDEMEVCLVPVPITYVCSNPEVDFSLYRRESNGDQEETG